MKIVETQTRIEKIYLPLFRKLKRFSRKIAFIRFIGKFVQFMALFSLAHWRLSLFLVTLPG